MPLMNPLVRPVSQQIADNLVKHLVAQMEMKIALIIHVTRHKHRHYLDGVRVVHSSKKLVRAVSYLRTNSIARFWETKRQSITIKSSHRILLRQ